MLKSGEDGKGSFFFDKKGICQVLTPFSPPHSLAGHSNNASKGDKCLLTAEEISRRRMSLAATCIPESLTDFFFFNGTKREMVGEIQRDHSGNGRWEEEILF